ncbi:hypothetical protein BC943DRAFT_362472 [Umbelopsis sp. AD052]|nr:hypothetical protein BC943DRAFT_362472 [Umbelopsis sp. AD052]
MKSVLTKLAAEDNSMNSIYKDLLLEESEENELFISDDYFHLEGMLLCSLQQDDRPICLGALSRPYFRALVENMNICYGLKGKIPDEMQTSPFETLSIINSHRICELEERLKRMFSKIDRLPENENEVFLQFFRDFVIPNDIRTLLSLRTTEGSNKLEVMPPSLQQCMVSFTQLHQLAVSSVRRGVKPSVLTVGGKAFSKHVHRDLTAEFWGVCKGTEKMKNEAANTVLSKILQRSVWRNLHELPHGILAYEVRNREGYGARWTAKLKDRDDRPISWMFRGFLEPPMKDGHSVGWIH